MNPDPTDATAAAEEPVSLRLLHAEDRVRIFMTSVRVDATHATNANAWRRVAATMRPTDWIVWPTFWHADRAYFDNARAFMAGLPVSVDHVWVLGNTEAETRAASGAGFRSAWVNHNCWLDERIFRPMALPKEYRAVMVAQRNAHKRIGLASKVAGLAFLETPLFHLNAPDEGGELPLANHIRDLPQAEVPWLMNRSRVGLILSAIEGACYASSEYLLCGVPVVSTPSVGGRDVFYDATNSLIVEPDADAVAAGVDELARRAPDPDAIAARHVEQTQEFRSRFVRDVLGVVAREAGLREDPEYILASTFRHKMVDFIPESKARALVAS